jgi:hypothetical protein
MSSGVIHNSVFIENNPYLEELDICGFGMCDSDDLYALLDCKSNSIVDSSLSDSNQFAYNTPAGHSVVSYNFDFGNPPGYDCVDPYVICAPLYNADVPAVRTGVPAVLSGVPAVLSGVPAVPSGARHVHDNQRVVSAGEVSSEQPSPRHRHIPVDDYVYDSDDDAAVPNKTTKKRRVVHKDNNDDINNKKRILFTPDQVSSLIGYYDRQAEHRFSNEEVENISLKVSLAPQQVRVFFQNRRARLKKKVVTPTHVIAVDDDEHNHDTRQHMKAHTLVVSCATRQQFTNNEGIVVNLDNADAVLTA